jgi:hypothetical protein
MDYGQTIIVSQVTELSRDDRWTIRLAVLTGRDLFFELVDKLLQLLELLFAMLARVSVSRQH